MDGNGTCVDHMWCSSAASKGGPLRPLRSESVWSWRVLPSGRRQDAFRDELVLGHCSKDLGIASAQSHGIAIANVCLYSNPASVAAFLKDFCCHPSGAYILGYQTLAKLSPTLKPILICRHSKLPPAHSRCASLTWRPGRELLLHRIQPKNGIVTANHWTQASNCPSVHEHTAKLCLYHWFYFSHEKTIHRWVFLPLSTFTPLSIPHSPAGFGRPLAMPRFSHWLGSFSPPAPSNQGIPTGRGR